MEQPFSRVNEGDYDGWIGRNTHHGGGVVKGVFEGSQICEMRPGVRGKLSFLEDFRMKRAAPGFERSAEGWERKTATVESGHDS